MAVANALAYYDLVTITAVKRFIVHAQGVGLILTLGLYLEKIDNCTQITYR